MPSHSAVTLFRPVGLRELELMLDSGLREFPEEGLSPSHARPLRQHQGAAPEATKFRTSAAMESSPPASKTIGTETCQSPCIPWP